MGNATNEEKQQHLPKHVIVRVWVNITKAYCFTKQSFFYLLWVSGNSPEQNTLIGGCESKFLISPGASFMSSCSVCVRGHWYGRWAAALLCKRVYHLCRCVNAPDIWWRGWLSLNQERRGRGLPSASHSIRRDSVTFTVWLVRLRL